MNIVVFDFDDTLMASSEVRKKSDTNFEIISSNIDLLINSAKTFADIVFIITNAEKKWVLHCANTYLYSSKDTLLSLPIISTVDRGYNVDNDIEFWKSIAFVDVLGEFFTEPGKHRLFCIGDCIYDREAANSVREIYNNVSVKNVLFVQNPTIESLAKQQNLLYTHLEYLIKSKKHVDLSMYNNGSQLELREIIQENKLSNSVSSVSSTTSSDSSNSDTISMSELSTIKDEWDTDDEIFHLE